MLALPPPPPPPLEVELICERGWRLRLLFSWGAPPQWPAKSNKENR